MIGLVVAAHGGLAQGFAEAMELIVGPQEQFKAINLEPDMAPEVLKEKMLAAVAEVDTGQGALIAVDLFGGTPCNIALAVTAETNAVCLVGVNLGMLLEAVGMRGSGEAPIQIAEKLVDLGKEGIQQLKI
ncbi:MAG: PTS sugar transporter subunit IIA [Firmicutes bacterium]|nr:PTS sugar transporter subunit IIA [Bacillota bacterium]